MARLVAVSFVAVFAFAVCAADASAPSRRSDGLFRCQIHRAGGAATRPDNALESCLWAWGNGCAPEIDARLTKDGVAIAFHDPNLGRLGRGIPKELATAKIAELNWEQIRDVDVGSYLKPEFGYTRIATMQSVLTAMVGRPDRILYLDEKGAPPALVAEMAGKLGVEKQIYFTSPSYWNVKKWRDLVPDGKGMVWIGFKWPGKITDETRERAQKQILHQLKTLEENKYYGVSQVQFHMLADKNQPEDPFCPGSAFLREQIKKLHDNGVTVQGFIWRKEGQDEEIVRRAWELGIDSFATDHPEFLFKMIRAWKAER